MGSNVAPPYANAYMAAFEEKYTCPNPWYQEHAILWRRYIDDIFCIWKGDSHTLDQFFQYLNSIRDELQFTIHQDFHSVSFLDTMVTINTDQTLITDLYTKPTDRNGLLHYQSCHPRHVKNDLPKSQYTRVQRIVSDPTIRETRMRQMTTKFVKRGYPTHILRDELYGT